MPQRPDEDELALWQQLQSRHVAIVVFESFLFILVMVLSLFGNLLVCYAVYRNPRLRYPSNYYIISLAMTDILQALCTMLVSVVFLSTGHWPFGKDLCYSSAITKFVLTKASIYTMALMALNRYYKIVKPSKYQALFKKKFIVVTAVLAYAIPIFVALVFAFALNQATKPSPGYALCTTQIRPRFLVIITILLFSPYIIIGFCYWKIHKTIKMHNASMSWKTSNVQDVKISKTLGVTVIAFVCLWLPVHVTSTVSILAAFSELPRLVTLLCTLLIFLASCVNPFIYGFMNRSFKVEFKKFLFPRPKPSVQPTPVIADTFGEREI